MKNCYIPYLFQLIALSLMIHNIACILSKTSIQIVQVILSKILDKSCCNPLKSSACKSLLSTLLSQFYTIKREYIFFTLVSQIQHTSQSLTIVLKIQDLSSEIICLTSVCLPSDFYILEDSTESDLKMLLGEKTS